MQIQNNFPLKEALWYKIGGTAKYLITCNNREDIFDAFNFIKQNNVGNVFVCGLGTNLLFANDYFEGAVIQISKEQKGEEDIRIIEDGVLEVFAGVEMEELIDFSLKRGLVGLEWAGGLPGTVGGAVRGNAGAYGGEIKDSLVSAEVLDYSGDNPEVRILSNEELQFSYRNSFIKQNKKMVVMSAKFQLQKTDEEGLVKAREIRDKNTQNRKDKHPLEYPNTGSVFINPREKEQVEKILSIYPDMRSDVEQKWYGKVAVAALIDRWGLKGFRIGDAQISEKHALFIVNLGDAKAIDVLQVIDTVKKKFFDTFGFELHVEVEIVKGVQ
jgi:UDP-N-acetylmuramate dehydrogenase